MRKPRMSILAKLMLIGALPVVVATTLVGVVLERRQQAMGMRRLGQSVERYAKLASEQVESAVAYNDRETAKEVLRAVAHDPEVVGIQLYDAAGASLHDNGVVVTPSELSERGVPILAGHHLSIAVPVTPENSAAGTLVITMTTRHVLLELDRARWLTVAIGGIAVLIALAIAFVIARGLSRRIRQIERVAIRVAAGDLNVPAMTVTSSDELGRTAAAVNEMLGHLGELISSRLVLDNVIQGLAIVSYDGTIAGETSAATATLIGPVARGERLWEHLPPRAQDELAVNFAQLALGVLPLDLLLDQLPRGLAVADRTLALVYTPLPDDKLLVAITDVTEQRASERAREAEAEAAALFQVFRSDRHALRRFVDDARQQLEAIAQAGEPTAMLAPLHTLKGNAALLHLDAWAARAHAAESAIVELGELTGEQLAALARAWQATEQRLAPILATGNGIEVSTKDFQRLVDLGRDLPELRRLLDEIQLESVALPFGRLAAHCAELAHRRGRDDLRIEIDDGGVRLDPVLWNPLWSVLVHVARNAVTHGMPVDRPSQVKFRARHERDGIVIEIADAGDGIRWDDLARLARKRGLPSASHDELVEAMFASQLSTADTTDEVAGRGVGLAAVALTCEVLGVIYDVDSVVGVGTTFRFWLPRVARRITCVS